MSKSILYKNLTCTLGFGKTREDLGRLGKIWEGLGRHGKIWKDLGRFGKTWEELAQSIFFGKVVLRLALRLYQSAAVWYILIFWPQKQQYLHVLQVLRRGIYKK